MAANFIIQQGADRLTARAADTPLLLGTSGSPTELALKSLYFRPAKIQSFPSIVADTLSKRLQGKVYPLHLAYTTNDFAIVGTTPEYFTFRGLTLDEGRHFALIGECVVGAVVAEKLGLKPGSSLISSPAGAFDLAGSFPLELTVTGILKKRNNAEDNVVLTDIKTAWIIDGIAHGHEDVVPEADSVILERKGNNLVAGPKVLSYTRITDENRNSFHFHGDPADYPIHSLIIDPADIRERVMLRGLFLDTNENALQLIIPEEVIGELTETLFSVRDLIVKGSIFMAVATVAITGLVFALSIRLRKREIHTMRMIGGTRGRMRQLLALEMLMVLFMSIFTALALTIVLIKTDLEIIENWL